MSSIGPGDSVAAWAVAAVLVVAIVAAVEEAAAVDLGLGTLAAIVAGLG